MQFPDAGSVRVLAGADFVSTYCTAKPGLVCGLPAIAWTGASSASSSSGFSVTAGPARGQQLGILLYSNSGPASLPFQGGTLCVGPSPLLRGPAVSSGGTLDQCDGQFALDVNAFASGVAGGDPDPFLSAPGTEVFCQWWGRDSVSTGSFLSDALRYIVRP